MKALGAEVLGAAGFAAWPILGPASARKASTTLEPKIRDLRERIVDIINFLQCKSGGILAWSDDVDPTVAKY